MTANQLGVATKKGTTMLSLDDLGAVLTELFPVREKWHNLGLQLKVSVTELLKIEAEYKNDHSTCLRLMLVKWLELGNASWKSLCEALQSPIVLGGDAALVNTLRNKYCPVEEKKQQNKRKVTEAQPATAAKVGEATYYYS